MTAMRILLALILIVLLSGGAWILNYEQRIVPHASCRNNLDGAFISRKDCEEYWKEYGGKPSTHIPPSVKEQ